MVTQETQKLVTRMKHKWLRKLSCHKIIFETKTNTRPVSHHERGATFHHLGKRDIALESRPRALLTNHEVGGGGGRGALELF